jgi:hypothetical protein
MGVELFNAKRAAQSRRMNGSFCILGDFLPPLYLTVSGIQPVAVKSLEISVGN